MATSAETAVVAAEATSAPAPAPTGDWTTEKSTTRSYWRWVRVKVKNKKTGEVTEKNVVKYIAKTEGQGQNQENWKKIEAMKDKDGNPLWNFFAENSFTRYTIKTMDAFDALIPEQEGPEAFDQRTYVANAGINYVQNSKLNALAVESKEGTGVNDIPPVPEHNQEEIDLRSYINEKPGRRIKTLKEKLNELFKKMGMDPSAIAAFLAGTQAEYAAAAASGVPLSDDGEGEEEEEEEEEGGEEAQA